MPGQRLVAPVARAAGFVVVCVLGLATAAPAAAQTPDQPVQLAAAPRFLVREQGRSSSGEPRYRDASGAAVLGRRIALDLRGVPLGAALDTVARASGLSLTYSASVVDVRRPVTLTASDLTVGAALSAMLYDAGVDVLLVANGRAALVKRGELFQTGSVVGQVTDAKSGTALVGATVFIEGTRLSTTTETDGRYRIGDVPAGGYTVRARYIGYAPASVSVTVPGEQEVTVDFVLERSAQKLDEVVTTGTLVPTEVKALPTPISIITAEDIERHHISRIDEALQLAVPSAVVWEPGNNPDPTTTQVSFRGKSSIIAGDAPKVYVDGIEIFDSRNVAISPDVIDRMEVIRGPQAAALYGSDAVGGVVAIFTKRGRSSRPEMDVNASVGTIESAYQGSGAISQRYAGGLAGQSGPASYRLGGGYSRVGDWLPNYRSVNPHADAAIRVSQGPLTVDLSARYYDATTEFTNDPTLAGIFPGNPFYTTPTHIAGTSRQRSYTARLEYRPTAWWQHALTAGVDRFAHQDRQRQPTHLTPDDTLLYYSTSDAQKQSVSYASTITAHPAVGVIATVTAGVDHWRTGSSASFGRVTVANPTTIVAGTASIFPRPDVKNTGAYAQTVLNFRETVFLTMSARAEWNPGFGDELGVPVSPRVGATYVREIGGTTVKLRASYGSAIRPPAPGSKDSVDYGGSIQRANPLLEPERKSGPDGGVDVVFGRRGSLSVTYVHERAKDLLTLTTFGATPTGEIIFQLQNVSEVRNTGWEFEGTLLVGPLTVTGQYAAIKSRPHELGPNYSGDLRVGEQVTGVPVRTGSLSVTATPLRRTSVTGSLAYIGSRTQSDSDALNRCFAGTGPCDPTFQFLANYPSVTRINLSVEQQFLSRLTGYVAVVNLANTGDDSRGNSNGTPVPGRTTTIGARVRL